MASTLASEARRQSGSVNKCADHGAKCPDASGPYRALVGRTKSLTIECAMDHSSSMILGIRLKLPPEALLPMLFAAIALMVLLFASDQLSAWKVRQPTHARTLGIVIASGLTIITCYFLFAKLANQFDPNNAGANNMSLFDAPMIGFFAAVGALFWRFGDQRRIGFWMGVAVGVMLIAKPFVWPVVATLDYMNGSSRVFESHNRGLFDPEHYLFILIGLVAIACGFIARLPSVDELPASNLASALPPARVVASHVD